MIEFLTSLTALPNLHPALVHFPIALVFSAVAVEAASLLLKKQVWLERTAALLCGLALVSAGAAFLAGRSAADTVRGIPAGAEAILAEHSDYALWTLVVLALATALRVTASAGDRNRSVSRFGVMRSIGVLALLIGATLIACTADLGGSLVYKHGVAVATSGFEPNLELATRGPADERPVSGVGQELISMEDGSLVWRPDSVNPSPLGTILLAPENGTLEAIEISERSDGLPGLQIEVSGFAVLNFSETFGDVAIEATVDLSGFQGTVGLGHHINSVENGVFFTVDSSRQASLTRRQVGSKNEFDSAPVTELSVPTTLSTSVAGSHLKGQVNGQVVVHGHGSSGDDGQVGILVDGRGYIGIERITVTPLSQG